MLPKELENGFVIREVTQQELSTILRLNFDRIFKNRSNELFSSSIPDDINLKIKERANKDNRFRLRLVLFQGQEVVGWHFGYAVDAETYYMQNSAILESFRGQGLYGRLLETVLERISEEGFQVVTSSHHPNNAAVLIPKLKAGFIINSVQFHEKFRFLVDLKYFFCPNRRKAFGKNIGLDL
ncbi:GNAT family N-acetyltransferase [Bdellovibrio sp. BCCA]|uniref:GNAT family N-acetyltransferase n=1 Tax=Bdellovibrio sp. BCCA TaxID=3136281 RepID=UPI0030F240AF